MARSNKVWLTSIFLCGTVYAEDKVSVQPPPRNFTTFTALEFLYWKYDSPALIFGRDGVGLSNSAPQNEIAVTKKGTSFSPRFTYNPGYQLTLGFKFGPKRAFDLTARYAWMYTHPKKSVSANEISASFLPISWLTSNNLASATYSEASLGVRIHYHSPEAQFGYTFVINPHLSLRPYTALTSFILVGDLKAKYAFTPPGGMFTIARTHGQSFAWSIGPKIGLDFVVMAWKNWGIFSNVNLTHQAAQLFMNTQQVDELANGTEIVLQKGKLNELRSLAIVGLEIGPFWDKWFYNNRYHFQLRALWRTATLAGTHLSFLDNNNIDIPIGVEFRGFNIRALFEF